MSKKKIGLYGIGGLYNYGCEAIVRGTVEIIRAAHNDCEITYFSPRKENDELQINDLGINIVQVKRRNRILLERVINKALRMCYFNVQIPNENYYDVVDKCDVIFSIGGDIYTIPKFIRDKGKYYYRNNLIEMGKCVKKKGKKLVIFGASIGPFGPYDKAVNYYSDNLKKADLIVAREETCLKNCYDLGVTDNVVFMPDPAFFVPGDICDCNAYDNKAYFGVNLSPLSFREVFGNADECQIAKFSNAIRTISNRTGLKVMLIPHVLSPDISDNDEAILSKIMDYLSDAEAVLVHPNSFLDAKKYIDKCKFVIAARMHCAINSICENVPVLFLSYSDKAVGMSKYVYGNDNWVVSINESSDYLVEKAVELNSKTAELTSYICERKKNILSSITNLESINRIKETIN